MKVKRMKNPGRLVAALLLLTLCPGYAATEASAPDRASENPAVGTQPHEQSARRLLGQNLRNQTGETLGEVKDLVVNPQSGRVVFALVGSGGFLGFGEKFRAVPFSALERDESTGRLTLSVDKVRWEAAPTVARRDFAALSAEGRIREIHDYFREAGVVGAIDESAGLAQTTHSDRSNQLMSVERVLGREVVNAGQEVGQVDDVMVNFENRHASAIIDPDDDYTGSSERYLIGFSRLMPATEEGRPLSTSLTSDDFKKAQPIAEDWWLANADTPFIWSTYGYGYTGAPGVAGSLGAEQLGIPPPQAEVADASALKEVRRTPVADVKNALESHPGIAGAASRIELEERDQTLVIRGTVSSQQLKAMIADTVTTAARGWKIDEQIEVRDAAE